MTVQRRPSPDEYVTRDQLTTALREQDKKSAVYQDETNKKLDATNGKLDKLSLHLREYFGDGNGHKGAFEREVAKAEARYADHIKAQANINQAVMNMIHLQEQAEIRADERAKLLAEEARKTAASAALAAKRSETYRGWIQTATGAGAFTVIWEVSRWIWHWRHPVHVVLAVGK